MNISTVCLFCSELELKPQGRLSVTVVKANLLKNMEMIGKSDPYVVMYIRPIFKFKTKVANDNLNPVWNQTFELIVEDKETQALILEVLIYLTSYSILYASINAFFVSQSRLGLLFNSNSIEK